MSIDTLSLLVKELMRENKELRDEIQTLRGVLWSYEHATGMEQVEGKVWRPVVKSEEEPDNDYDNWMDKLNKCSWVDELSK